MKKLIKHFIDRADGFSIGVMTGDLVITFEGRHYSLEDDKIIYTRLFSKIIYPLFLQRAIEGVNLKDNGYRIEQMYDMIDICDSEEYNCQIRFEYEDYTSPDQAKIAALTWIMEQEEG